jgi:hypothetical protein
MRVILIDLVEESFPGAVPQLFHSLSVAWIPFLHSRQRQTLFEWEEKQVFVGITP